MSTSISIVTTWFNPPRCRTFVPISSAQPFKVDHSFVQRSYILTAEKLSGTVEKLTLIALRCPHDSRLTKSDTSKTKISKTKSDFNVQSIEGKL